MVDLNNQHNLIQKIAKTCSIISYRSISSDLIYLFIGEETDKIESKVINISDDLPKYSLNVEITKKFPLTEILEYFIYEEDEKIKLIKYKFKYFLYQLFISENYE